MKRPFNAFLALLAMGSLRVWSAESSLSSNCVDSLNANSASVPMVSPRKYRTLSTPVNVVGSTVSHRHCRSFSFSFQRSRLLETGTDSTVAVLMIHHLRMQI